MLRTLTHPGLNTLKALAGHLTRDPEWLVEYREEIYGESSFVLEATFATFSPFILFPLVTPLTY